MTIIRLDKHWEGIWRPGVQAAGKGKGKGKHGMAWGCMVPLVYGRMKLKNTASMGLIKHRFRLVIWGESPSVTVWLGKYPFCYLG